MSEINYTYVKGKGWVPEGIAGVSKRFQFRGDTWEITKVDHVPYGEYSWMIYGDLFSSGADIQEYANNHWRNGHPGIKATRARYVEDDKFLYLIKRVP